MLTIATVVSLSIVASEILADVEKISPSQPRVLDAGYFGIHFHRLQLIPGEQAIPTDWPPFQFGYLRLWDSRTRWADVQPAPAKWNFSRLDHYVNEANARGVKVLYTLGSTPLWATARPDETCSYGKGCAAEPRDMEDWRAYVRAVSRRYQGRICCYELWNEPKFPPDIMRDRDAKAFYTGSVANMVEMARIARQVLNEEDPSAILLSPGFVNGTDRLDMFLAAGGRDYVRAVAYHFYAGSNEERMLKEIKAVRRVMQKNGVAGMPLWNTETGLEVYELGQPLPQGVARITREEGAAMMVRQIVLGAFAGLDKYFYYAWDNDKSGMVDRTGRSHPSRDAMLLAQRWLLGAKPDRCDIEDGRPTVCWGEKNAKSFAIVWNPKNSGSVDVPLSEGLRITSRQAAVPSWVTATQNAPGAERMLATPNPAFYTFERIAQ